MTHAATVLAAGGTGEAVIFWIIAPVLVLAALGMIFARKAVHAALLLAVTMIGLAVFYIVLGAPFLGIVQIVVYTGSVMMLFLFVLMLVGVDSSDSLVETIRHQRWLAVVVAVLFGVLVVTMTSQAAFGVTRGLDQANSDGNVEGIANLLFSRYVFAFEATSALLITAALGAMVLAHRERLVARPTQRELSAARFRDGTQVTPLPSPGVYARHNAVDTPALLPDGSVSELSLSRVLVARGERRAPGPAAEAPSAIASAVEQRSDFEVDDAAEGDAI